MQMQACTPVAKCCALFRHGVQQRVRSTRAVAGLRLAKCLRDSRVLLTDCDRHAA